MVDTTRWELEDTFRVWREKYNELRDSSVITSFDNSYNERNPSLVFPVDSGRIRIGNESIEVPGVDLNIDPENQAFVVLYTDPETIEIRQYPTEDDYPSCGKIIPLFYVETNTESIDVITDLRTWAVSASSAAQADSILQFDKNVCFDTVIPEDKNAISVSPVVDDGVTVTVSDGSVWVVL